MAQKSGNNVKPPASGDKGDKKMAENTLQENLAEQHHGESTDPWQSDKRIGQHNGAGRPPLMKK
jgi:hypothetical protein